MSDELTRAEKLVGVKQCQRALREGGVRTAYFARDAEDRLIAPLVQLCEEKGIAVVWCETMRELGNACGIAVGAAVAVILG